MLLAQLNFHADAYSVAIDAPQLAPLRGRELRVAVRAGMAGMSGQATLDGTQLDDPACSVSYADMSPAPPQPPPRRCPPASPFSTAAGDAPADAAGGCPHSKFSAHAYTLQAKVACVGLRCPCEMVNGSLVRGFCMSAAPVGNQADSPLLCCDPLHRAAEERLSRSAAVCCLERRPGQQVGVPAAH